MHSLLKRQLKKIGYNKSEFNEEKFENFIKVVNQAYYDNDEDRALLENTLTISSKEMQGLYEELKQKSKHELTKSEEKYNRLVQNLHKYYFFYRHDTNGDFTYLSDSITNILGYTKEEFLTNCETYLTNDEMNKKVIEHTNLSISGIEQPPYKLSIYCKDRTVAYLEVTELPVFDEAGKVIFIDGIAKDITKQYKIEQEISHLAKHDPLTGLANRFYLEDQLKDLIYNAQRQKSRFALLFLDLDHFKYINDTLGHDIGDKLLQEVANRIKPNIRHADIFARIGGDEFVIVITDIDDDYLTIIVNKIIGLMRKTWHIDTHELKVSTSIGIALYPRDATSMLELMKKADIAMYKSKESGRDNFNFFTDELNVKIHKEMQLEQEMSSALLKNQFVLYYQPKQKLFDNNLIGAEALIRWEHPKLGLIYPDSFISLAESTGFIVKLGRWVIKEACCAIARFNKYDVKHKLHVSVNVSTRQLQNDDVYEVIKEALIENNISASQLFIEITESLMIQNSKTIIKILENIASLGVHICMDDFGTGYSSLSYLNKLPISSLKIDKSFVNDIPRNGNDKIILNTIIAMGKALQINIIAEGVEEEYQRQYLLKSGCLYYQGYLFSKPVAEENYINILKGRKKVEEGIEC
jgi:diguanylate cyclase (GGDEF)-like protein/PAS domain S-box-containing protein